MSHLASPPPLTRPPSSSISVIGAGSSIGGHARFKRLGKIGEGSFGDVFKALDTETQELVAVKVINLEEAEEEIDEIRQEITMLSELMEFLGGGSVHDLLDSGPLDESVVAVITRELLKACDYLHTNGKIHRDIKCANVLLSSKGDIKISDFGVTAKLTNTIQKRNTFVGTPYWMAPEVIKQSDYNEKADIWSIGITVLEMFQGNPPFHDVHPMKALFLIPKSDPPSLENHPSASRALKDFVRDCCQKDHTKRPGVKQLLSSKFVRSAKKNAILQEIVAERSMRSSHQQRGPASVTAQAQAGEDEEDLEEEVNGEDSWSFTVKQPSTTAAAAKANAAAAASPAAAATPAKLAVTPAPVVPAPVTVPHPAASPPSSTLTHSPPIPARPSRASISALSSNQQALSHSPDMGTVKGPAAALVAATFAARSGGGGGVVSPPTMSSSSSAAAAASSSLTNTIRPGAGEEDDISSGSGSDDDDDADDEDGTEGYGTVRMSKPSPEDDKPKPDALTNMFRPSVSEQHAPAVAAAPAAAAPPVMPALPIPSTAPVAAAAVPTPVESAAPSPSSSPAPSHVASIAAAFVKSPSPSPVSPPATSPSPPPPSSAPAAVSITSPTAGSTGVTLSPSSAAAAASNVFRNALAHAVASCTADAARMASSPSSSRASSAPSAAAAVSAALSTAQQALLALETLHPGLGAEFVRAILGAEGMAPSPSPSSAAPPVPPFGGSKPAAIGRSVTLATTGSSLSSSPAVARASPSSSSGAPPPPPAPGGGFSNVKNLWQQMEKDKLEKQQQAAATPTKAGGAARAANH